MMLLKAKLSDAAGVVLAVGHIDSETAPLDSWITLGLLDALGLAKVTTVMGVDNH